MTRARLALRSVKSRRLGLSLRSSSLPRGGQPKGPSLLRMSWMISEPTQRRSAPRLQVRRDEPNSRKPTFPGPVKRLGTSVAASPRWMPQLKRRPVLPHRQHWLTLLALRQQQSLKLWGTKAANRERHARRWHFGRSRRQEMLRKLVLPKLLRSPNH